MALSDGFGRSCGWIGDEDKKPLSSEEKMEAMGYRKVPLREAFGMDGDELRETILASRAGDPVAFAKLKLGLNAGPEAIAVIDGKIKLWE